MFWPIPDVICYVWYVSHHTHNHTASIRSHPYTHIQPPIHLLPTHTLPIHTITPTHNTTPHTHTHTHNHTHSYHPTPLPIHAIIPTHTTPPTPPHTLLPIPCTPSYLPHTRCSLSRNWLSWRQDLLALSRIGHLQS